MNKKVLYAVAAVAVLVAAGFMITRALQSSLVYFVMPSEYARDAESFEGRRIRLGGLVEPGSVIMDDSGLALRFVVTDQIQSYPVTYDGAPPDLFQQNGGVVVEGRFHDDVVVSDNLLVKHSENYHPPEDGEPIHVEALKESLR